MTLEQPEGDLKAARFLQIENKVLESRPANTTHSHDYAIRGVVLDGLFIVTQDGQAVSYRAGETFAVPAGRSHSESVGPNGARIVVGRKY